MARYGLIAGNGRFPALALEAARNQGDDVVVIAIEKEADPAIAALATTTHWVNIGQLARIVDLLQQEGVTEVMMTGQVKHVSLFSGIKPDWKLLQLLVSLKEKNTAALIGGIGRVLAESGIQLVDSTRLLKHLMAPSGVLTRRKPNSDEEADLRYGRRLASALATADIGQSVAICEKACVAAEAMEGTDAMLKRAAELTGGRPLRLAKASRGRAHLLFDVPVIGPQTVVAMADTNTTALIIDAERTLLLDRDELFERANQARIAISSHRVDAPE